MRTGRPRNTRLRLALLERLPNETLSEILRTGSFTRPQLSHYIREFVRQGIVEPRLYLSHLDTDGPGAKRYGLTRSGRRYRERLRQTESRQPPLMVSPDARPTQSPAGVVARPPLGTGSTRSAQRFIGAHNLCYGMVIEASFRRPFHWEKEYLMANGSWVKRHSPFGKGIHLEESGGQRWDAAGAQGHRITVKFRVAGTDPLEVDAKADRTASTIRHILETEYGCTLSEPERRGGPKFSIVGDPMAKAIRQQGEAVHGPVGVDDTPEPATLELDSARAAQEYVEGVRSLPTLAQKVDALIEGIAELRKAQEALVDASTVQTGVLTEILTRMPKAAATEPPVPPKPSDGSGYA